MNVLVIGGSGWVGHNIVKALVAMGDDVTILSRGKRDVPKAVAGLPRISGDKTDEAFLSKVLQENAFDAVVDSVPSEKAIDLLAKYRRFYGRYLHCSSVGVYNPMDRIPADETMPIGKKSYGGFVAKVATDQLALKYVAAGELSATILRPCCITGIGMLPLDNIGGRRSDFLTDIAAGKTLDLLDDGKALLQLINVEDLGRAFAMAVHNSSSVNRVYNICGPYAVSVKHYCELIARAMGQQLHSNSLSFDEMIQKYGEEIRAGLAFLSENMCHKTELAQKELGFVPQYTLEQSLLQNIQWAVSSHLC